MFIGVNKKNLKHKLFKEGRIDERTTMEYADNREQIKRNL